jgi:DNA topoisomerase I
MTRLRRVSCSRPGFTRRRRGSSFHYFDAGVRVRDPEILQRIDDLVIPPAWEDVWICPDAKGHLQAVGTDAKGRRQYLYHPAWRERRDQLKHRRVLSVAGELPKARRRVAEDLDERGLGRDRVLACCFRLLDLGFFRVGGEEYMEENGSFGLSTLLRQHVAVRRGESLTFDYVAKSGIHRQVEIVDPDAYAVVSALARRMGQEDQLFGYRDGRTWRDVTAADINTYVHDTLGDATAKDFRTWHATVLAAAYLAAELRGARLAGKSPMTDRAVKRAVTSTMREVSGYLGNTPAVCRASYVDPRLVDLFSEGRTIPDRLVATAELQPPLDPKIQGQLERAVLRLLRS